MRNILFYTALLFFRGYLFGSSDHVDLLSYVQYLIHPEYYPSDFFVQDLAARIPNERTALAWLLAQSGEKGLEWVCFLLHVGSTLALVAALERIAGLFIARKTLVGLALVLLFFPFSLFSLGGNDLYYNLLINSSISKALGAWAFWFLLQKKHTYYTVLLLLATAIHPIAGGQVFVLTAGAGLVQWYSTGRKKAFIVHILAYLLLVIPYAYALLGHYKGQSPNTRLLFEIVQFRLPHHFIPAQFGTLNYVVLLPLMLFGLWYFRRENRFFYTVFLLVLLPALLYIVVVGALHSPSLFVTQWFKTTIWAKAFALFAVVAFLEKHLRGIFLAQIERLEQWFLSNKTTKSLIYGALSLVMVGIMCGHPNGLVGKRAYHLPFANFRQNTEIDIALKARTHTPQNAVFVQPGSFSAFKYFSARSSYVDIKAVVHHQDGFVEWYRRVQEVYGLSAANRDTRSSLYAQADACFLRLNTDDFKTLSQKGITHIVTQKAQLLQFPVLYENSDYKIYRIE